MGRIREAPPSDVEDIRRDAGNPSRSVYVYIGERGDEGWFVAEEVGSALTRLVVYLVEDRAIVSEWTGTKRPRGIIFGYGLTPLRFLNKGESEDSKAVRDAILDANEA